jgi:ubiquinone/menaquinone biosynthesis C-methylase UbiE
MSAAEFQPDGEPQPAVYAATKRQRYNRVAPIYDLLDLPFEYRRYRAIRPKLFTGLSGIILDAGVGTGRNMPFYPPECRAVGIDLSPGMIACARKRRDKLGKDVELLEMNVLATPFPDRHFDAIAATFLFCVLDDHLQLAALRELNRICKTNGVIRFLDYKYSSEPFRRFIMKLWAPWVRWIYGAGFDRNTEQYIPEAGLELLEKRFLYQDTIRLMVARPVGRPR